MTAQIYEFPHPQDREGRQPGARRSPLRHTDAPKCRRPVSTMAMDWAWTRPVRGPRQHVLLALAKKVRPKTEIATPSMPELVEMTGLSETTIRAHIQAMSNAGIITVEVSNGGRHKRSTYTLPGSATPQQVRGRKGSETPQEATPYEPETPQLPRKNPPTDAPVVPNCGTRGVREATADADAAPEADALFPEPVTSASIERKRIKIAQAIADRYCELEPMSKYVNVLGIVKRPLESDRFSGEMVMAAVERLAKEHRTLTLETLRVELVGFTPRSNGSQRTNLAPLRERLKQGGAA